MVPTYDMYSPTARHQSSTYALTQNYGHHQTYSQYTDNINFNPCGVMDNGMNNNYQQNLPSSWPIYTVSPSNNPSRQHVLLEDWMPLTTSPNNYQTQNVMHFSTDNTQTFHLQRNIGDVGPADYSLTSSEHMRIQEKLEPSSETHEHPVNLIQAEPGQKTNIELCTQTTNG
uniref:Caudal n=1 Tax=Parasteatoda tepidariorum TaxID=114398 RepID=A0A2L2Y9L7_PARTP